MEQQRSNPPWKESWKCGERTRTRTKRAPKKSKAKGCNRCSAISFLLPSFSLDFKKAYVKTSLALFAPFRSLTPGFSFLYISPTKTLAHGSPRQRTTNKHHAPFPPLCHQPPSPTTSYDTINHTKKTRGIPTSDFFFLLDVGLAVAETQRPFFVGKFVAGPRPLCVVREDGWVR